MTRLSQFIYHDLLGWQIAGAFPSRMNKMVIIVAPHTSWWDFVLGILIRKVLDEDIHYIGKKSLFNPPFGWFFRWTGGTPIDRGKRSDTVGAIVEIFGQRQKFRLALSPEGTRKKVEKWKTGFYYIAKEAQVPILMVAFDYGRKEVKISEPFLPTGHIEEDLPFIRSFYADVKGKYPDQF